MEWIQQGSKGDDVLEVQKKLQAKGFDPGPIDGIFGSQTTDAVRRFQEANSLQVDGIVGPETGGALGMLEAEEAAGKPQMADRGDSMKAKTRSVDPAAGVKAEASAKKVEETKKAGEATFDALKKSSDDRSDAVEAVTGAMKSTEKKVDEKIGGSLWSRIRRKKTNRDR